MNRTYSATKDSIIHKWYVIDATGIPVGRLAAQVAQILRGKNKPTFTYSQDCGDYVIVINAERVVLTGNKEDELIYWHTGWPGGIKNISRGKMREDKPEKLIEKAVWGMTPKNKLGHAIFGKLKVYAGPNHPHAAQMPEVLDISTLRRAK